ncbi:MAG: AAA family ATPase [Desulfosudaceae bacterium]
MYLDYWGFNESPFVNIPSEYLFFESPQHEEALNRLLYVINYRQGVAMLTGEVGSGKSTVTKNLAGNLPQGKTGIRVLTNPALSPVDFIRAVLLEFGINVKTNSKSMLIDQLRKKLEADAEQGEKAVLIVDEAHAISSRDVMEELRMLLNLQYKNRFLLTLIMVGQPPLLSKIESVQPLKERISMRYHIPPLDSENTVKYIFFRTRRAGSEKEMFTEEALSLIYNYSQGIPLRVNNLCDRCFLMGMMNKSQLIDAEIVNQAITDLG